MAEESGGWYVRSRGRTLGPFSWAQLESLRDRGQLARFHEVSQDRQAWMAASGLSQLFGASDANVVLLPSAGSAPASADRDSYGFAGDPAPRPTAGTGDDQPVWFFARDGSHQGPVPLGELRRMAASGEINSFTQVWKNGMPNWVPGHQVPELGFGPVTAPSPHQATQVVLQPAGHTPTRTSGLAIASLVLGILWLCGLGSLLATIFGAVALHHISRSRGQVDGKGMAIAGLVLGILGLSLFTLPFFTSYLAALLHQTS